MRGRGPRLALRTAMAGKLLAGIGVAALVVFGVGGLVALGVVRERVTLVVQDSSVSAQRGPAPVELLAEDVAAVRADLAALGAALGPQLEELHASLDGAATQRGAAHSATIDRLNSAVVALSARVDSLAAASALREARTLAALEELRATSSALAQNAATGPGAATEIAAAPALPSTESSAAAGSDSSAPVAAPAVEAAPGPVAEAAPAQLDPTPPPEAAAPAPRKFLSFTLPSKSFSFAGRQRLAIVPSLSRVGFDAKSTLHDFSGVTQKVEGELEVDLAQPALAPAGSVLVDARSLDTGMADRDAAMREHLDTQRHAQLRFTWTELRDAQVDLAQQRLSAVAVGRLSIKGVEREVAMPVQVSVDSSQRVGIEGELKLRLRDFGVEPPSQLGMIRVENEVRVWISLRARSLGAAKAVARDAK